jgi:hypothetical protein
MLGNENTVLWLTPHAAVVRQFGTGFMSYCYLRENYTFRLNVDGKAIHALARSSEAFSDIVDVVRRLLLADVSGVNELELRWCDERFPLMRGSSTLQVWRT